MTEADDVAGDGNKTDKVDDGDDVVGTFGLALGVFALCCIPLGFGTWLLTWLAVAPLAGLGLWCSSFARGGLRTLGNVINLPQLVLGLGYDLVFLAALMLRV